jgi:hypothetical protein
VVRKAKVGKASLCDSWPSESHCALPRIRHILSSGQYLQVVAVSEQKKKSGWLWPLGVVATGLGAAGVVIFRGCWHRNMSWPVRFQDHSYQVCLGCGIKRLFDEQAFRSYGPYSYDLSRLVARHRDRNGEGHPQPAIQRNAS